MTDTTRKPRAARIPGFQANLSIFIPVDKQSLKSQSETSAALHAAEQAGDLSAVMALPGVKLVAIRNARWAPLAADTGEAKAEEGKAGKEDGSEDEQLDVEDMAGPDGGDITVTDTGPAGFDPDDEAALDAKIEAQHGKSRKRA